ncbi:histidine decarboxylase maturation protein HdcB [Ligilactobacillus cholophilus]|uniref:histidine decarboxylase maturation protein HdcB n=1 Tax=Ligilactobacillus cholophilus TaxID=3050131 RepID=UPI0025B071C9|nr:histidine decarboxylase maturation protein HdcB [Ligilactobacillus cholophilus]
MNGNRILQEIPDKINQVIVDVENNKQILCAIGRNKIYLIKANILQNKKREHIVDVDFISGVPNGKLKIKFDNGEIWNFTNIIKGRVFDFKQELMPGKINEAGYDNTIRGEFPQLLDLDHAEEIDKLRRYMQSGFISHYEYDDCNPVYPKAGK